MATAKKPETVREAYKTVLLPRATGREEDFVFVALNGKAYKIRRGIPVRVPRPVYDILRESQRMQERQDRYDEQLAAQVDAKDRLYNLK